MLARLSLVGDTRFVVFVSCFDCSGAHRDLHSFPTRRSSDLPTQERADMVAISAFGGERVVAAVREELRILERQDRKSTRLNSSHLGISYAVFCLKKKMICLGGIPAFTIESHESAKLVAAWDH